jgi:hypothetical protein
MDTQILLYLIIVLLCWTNFMIARLSGRRPQPEKVASTAFWAHERGFAISSDMDGPDHHRVIVYDLAADPESDSAVLLDVTLPIDPRWRYSATDMTAVMP